MLEFNFSPFPALETPRLFLRRIDKYDVDQIFTLRSDAKNMKFIPRPLLKNHKEAKKQIILGDQQIDLNLGINWALTLKPNKELIGIIGFYRTKPAHFRSEIGYMIFPKFRGKGLVSEAIKVVVKFGFNVMKLHSIEALIDPDNIASEKVLQKNGFVKEGYLKENEFFDGKFLDTVIYSRLKK